MVNALLVLVTFVQMKSWAGKSWMGKAGDGSAKHKDERDFEKKRCTMIATTTKIIMNVLP